MSKHNGTFEYVIFKDKDGYGARVRIDKKQWIRAYTYPVINGKRQSIQLRFKRVVAALRWVTNRKRNVHVPYTIVQQGEM